MDSRRCNRCGEDRTRTEFAPSQWKDGWCKACYREWHRSRYTPSTAANDEVRQCQQCGTEYQPKTRRPSIYCSIECKVSARKAVHKTERLATKQGRICQNCGSDISHLRGDSKWCGHSCGEAARRTRVGPDGRRAVNLKQYGLTIDSYEQMLAAQGGGCAICTSPVHPGKDLRRLHIDHDHETGRVRGILCANCNRVLGLVGDDPELLIRASEYLLRFG